MSNKTSQYDEKTQTYKKPCECMYHIYSDEFDEHDDDIEKILHTLEDLIKDNQTNIRISKDTEWNEEDGYFEDGDTIFSIGSYPN